MGIVNWMDDGWSKDPNWKSRQVEADTPHAGICVGGPLDGREITSKYNWLKSGGWLYQWVNDEWVASSINPNP